MATANDSARGMLQPVPDDCDESAPPVPNYRDASLPGPEFVTNAQIDARLREQMAVMVAALDDIERGDVDGKTFGIILAAALQFYEAHDYAPAPFTELMRYCLANGVTIAAAPTRDYISAFWYMPEVAADGLAIDPGNYEALLDVAWREARADGPVSERSLARDAGVTHRTLKKWRAHLAYPGMVATAREVIAENPP